MLEWGDAKPRSPLGLLAALLSTLQFVQFLARAQIPRFGRTERRASQCFSARLSRLVWNP